jgi:hypothetical protein
VGGHPCFSHPPESSPAFGIHEAPSNFRRAQVAFQTVHVAHDDGVQIAPVRRVEHRGQRGPVGSVFVHGWTMAAIEPTFVTIAITMFAIDVVLWIVVMLRHIMTTRGGSN